MGMRYSTSTRLTSSEASVLQTCSVGCGTVVLERLMKLLLISLLVILGVIGSFKIRPHLDKVVTTLMKNAWRH